MSSVRGRVRHKSIQGLNPERHHLGSNPSGNQLMRPNSFNTQVKKPMREAPRKKHHLPHQTVERSPWNFDPYKIASARMMPSIKTTRANITGIRDLHASNIGPAKSTPLPIYKQQALINPALKGSMRGHTDTRRHQTKRDIASSVASNNRLILDRALG